MIIKILRSISISTAIFLTSVTLWANEMTTTPATPTTAPIKSAIAVLVPTEGSNVSGAVRFTQTIGGVRVVADVAGLKPGAHGFHIHEFGNISAADGLSTGGHFNPAHAHHGAPNEVERHAGDMGNLTADSSGHAVLDYTDTIIALSGPTSIIGRGVVVHADADDLKSQPVGNAGKRVATGVIGVSQ